MSTTASIILVARDPNAQTVVTETINPASAAPDVVAREGWLVRFAWNGANYAGAGTAGAAGLVSGGVGTCGDDAKRVLPITNGVSVWSGNTNAVCRDIRPREDPTMPGGYRVEVEYSTQVYNVVDFQTSAVPWRQSTFRCASALNGCYIVNAAGDQIDPAEEREFQDTEYNLSFIVAASNQANALALVGGGSNAINNGGATNGVGAIQLGMVCDDNGAQFFYRGQAFTFGFRQLKLKHFSVSIADPHNLSSSYRANVTFLFRANQPAPANAFAQQISGGTNVGKWVEYGNVNSWLPSGRDTSQIWGWCVVKPNMGYNFVGTNGTLQSVIDAHLTANAAQGWLFPSGHLQNTTNTVDAIPSNRAYLVFPVEDQVDFRPLMSLIPIT